MRRVNAALFERMKSRQHTFVTCWLVVRQDGVKFGFTSADQQFDFDLGDGNGTVTYFPDNGIATDAVSEKNDFSTSNTSATVVFSAEISELDVRNGAFDYAEAKSFWVDPTALNLGYIPIQKGNFGEVVLKNGKFEAELLSILDRLQPPFGRFYYLNCDAHLGDTRCGVEMTPPVWAPNTTWLKNISGDARIGGVVKPTVYNGCWYECVGATGTSITQYWPRGITYGGLGPDPFTGTGINPFNGLGPMWGLFFAQLYNMAISQPPTTPGTDNVVAVTMQGGNTGSVEPVWPTTLGATITDGQLTWKCIDARVKEGGVVTGLISRTVFQDANLTEASGTFQYGVLQWLTGENVGKITEVRQHTAGPPSQITMLEIMPAPIHKGDTYSISFGCPKIRTACSARYDNILNFRGFGDMPTEDRALTSPNFSTAQNLTFTQQSGGGKK